MPLMAYVSYWLQIVFHPETIFELLRVHRLSLLIFSFLMYILLLTRFGYFCLGIAIVYEITKAAGTIRRATVRLLDGKRLGMLERVPSRH